MLASESRQYICGRLDTHSSVDLRRIIWFSLAHRSQGKDVLCVDSDVETAEEDVVL